MAVFNGRWALVSANNTEAYMTATHAPVALKTKMTTLMATLKTNPEAMIEEINVNKAKGTMHLTILMTGETKSDLTLEMNKDVEHTGMDGIPAMVKLAMINDGKIVVHKKTSTFETEIVYSMSTCGNEMTVTMTCGGVTSMNKFVKM